MDPRFGEIVRAAVRDAKARNGLLWADGIADRIATATPLTVHRHEIAEQLTLEAIRTGAAVVMAQRAHPVAKTSC